MTSGNRAARSGKPESSRLDPIDSPGSRITVAQKSELPAQVRSNFVLKPARRERNFWMRRQGAKDRRQNAPTAHRDQIRELSGRKSPQKRPIRRRIGNVRFAETGWWRRSGPNCMLPTQSSNQSPNLEPATEFFAAETEAQNPPFPLLETGIDARRDPKRPP